MMHILGDRRSRMIFFCLLALLVGGLYYNTLDNLPTNWDDPALFAREALKSFSPEHLRTIFTMDRGATYQPVRDLSYMLDFALWGERVVFGMHVHSLVLYILMLLCGWVFLDQLFRAFAVEDKRRFIWASLTTLIYAVHPVHVESVAWLYARKETLLGIFTFLCLAAFLRARAGLWRYALLSLVFLVLAIMSKPTALAIPGVMVVLDVCLQLQRREVDFWRTRAWIYAPVLLIVVPMIVWLVQMLSSAGGVNPYHGGSFGTNLLAVSQIFIEYLSLIAFTINYAADYPVTLHADFHAWQAWAYLALNGLILGSVIWALRARRPLYIVFVAWFYIFLLPVSHLVPLSQTLTDRYALLSSLSFCAVVGYALMKLGTIESGRLPGLSPEFPKLLAAGLALFFIGAYSLMTIRQNDLWQDSQTLWEDTLAKYPQSRPANVNLAVVYLNQGRYAEAQALCLTVIEQQPYHYYAITNLALAQLMMQEHDHAINNFQQALKIKPDLLKARQGLADAYWARGDYEETYHRYRELQHLQESRGAREKGLIAYRLGYASWKTGHRDEAQAFLSQARASGEGHWGLLWDIGMLYSSMGERAPAEAICEQLRAALPRDGVPAAQGRMLRELERALP